MLHNSGNSKNEHKNIGHNDSWAKHKMSIMLEGISF